MSPHPPTLFEWLIMLLITTESVNYFTIHLVVSAIGFPPSHVYLRTESVFNKPPLHLPHSTGGNRCLWRSAAHMFMVIALDSRTPAFRWRLFSVHWLIRRNSPPPCEWIDGVSLATTYLATPPSLFATIHIEVPWSCHPLPGQTDLWIKGDQEWIRGGSTFVGVPTWKMCSTHEWMSSWSSGRLVRDYLGHYFILLAHWGTGKAISDRIGGLRNFALPEILLRIKISHMSGKSFRLVTWRNRSRVW